MDESPSVGPGLAAERTELAWGRNSLALLGCGAAVAKGLDTVTGERGTAELRDDCRTKR